MAAAPSPSGGEAIDPYRFNRRATNLLQLAEAIAVGPGQPPRVIVRLPSIAALPAAARELAGPRLRDTPAEGLLMPVGRAADLAPLCGVTLPANFLVLELAGSITAAELAPFVAQSAGRVVLLRRFAAGDDTALRAFAALVRPPGHFLACALGPADAAALGDTLRALGDDRLIFTLHAFPAADLRPPAHAVGCYRRLAAELQQLGSRAPIWIRNTAATAVRDDPGFLSKLLEASFLTGGLLADGLGDFVSIETEDDAVRATRLAYNVLQGAGARISKTEFVACPSCGRTLFDLQITTQRIRAQTGHLKGVKLAIMGCIVNGPGEMADADFGYVGGAPGKINLYVGKNCVQYNLPQAEADARLISLIKEHGKWIEPGPVPA